MTRENQAEYLRLTPDPRSQQHRQGLVGTGFAADIVVATEKDIEEYGDNIGMVIKPAIEQGSTLYAR